MVRKAIIVMIVLLSAFLFILALPTVIGGFSYCAQRGDSDLKMAIGANESGFLQVTMVRLERALDTPPPLPTGSQPTELSLFMLYIGYGRTFIDHAVPGFGFTAAPDSATSQKTSCSVYFNDLLPGDTLDSVTCVVYYPLLFSLSGALAAYPGIAFYRGPLRRWRRRCRGCCLNCGYDLTANDSGTCPECGRR